MRRNRTFSSNIRSLLLIINYKTFIVTILSVVATWLCVYYDIKANFPFTLVGIAIVFPVVFSIDSAYKRREKILNYLADFKAHLNAINLASRDWISPSNPEFHAEIKDELRLVFESLRSFCTVSFDKMEENENLLYQRISDLSSKAQHFRELNMYLGEVSRVNQYISKLTIDIENIKAIKIYPTPLTLRAYSKIFIFSFPILYGPYFAYISEEMSPVLEYIMPIISSFILVSLDNIQTHLEDPFDQIGEDDVHFDVEYFMSKMN